MNTIARISTEAQGTFAPPSPRVKPSAYGGVLLLAKAWAMLGGSERLSRGLRWQGQAGSLLLFVLVALPVGSPKSILAVAGFCSRLSDPLWQVLGWMSVITQRRLSRFASSPRHKWLQVLLTMASALAIHPATRVGEEGIIAVDSTTAEKRYGPHLPGIRPVYDAVQRRLVDGYEIVSACVVAGVVAWPVGLLPHRKADTASEREKNKRRRRKAKPGELPSKLDLALELVQLAVAAGVRASTVVGDSAFGTMWWLREIAALGRHWLVGMRLDRRLRIGAEIRNFRDWCAKVPLVMLEVSGQGTTVWGALLPEAVLLDKGCNRKGLVCRPAYFERRDRKGRVIHRWYLVTSQLAWDLTTVWQAWGWRWAIEELHRSSKQHMRLSDFHVRSWEGIVALIACTSLRASLLYFMRAFDPSCQHLSLEALVLALREAACVVEQPATGRAQVNLPPNLPAIALWQDSNTPFPAHQWPIDLKAA